MIVFMKIINNISQLSKIKNRYRDKKIVLVHGVFDIIHLGHLEYFKEAKLFGDILIVSVTANKFVNKGINRPYFDLEKRMNLLAELSVIDHVVASDASSSIAVIKSLKPNYYIKGPDYKIKKNDKAQNLTKESLEVKKYGGELKFTSGKIYSSTKILNSKVDAFKILKQVKKENKLKNIKPFQVLQDYKIAIENIKKEKTLVIGEIILDNYLYSRPLGTPSKENILSVNYLRKDQYLGGTIPIVQNLSELNKNVTFISLYNDNKIKRKIERNLKKKVKTKFFYDSSFKEVQKNRFIDISTNRKFFEYYDFNTTEIRNKNILNYLKKNLSKFKKVIVCDFGHGLFNKEIIQLIEKKSNFLCVNVQTNSGNRGFNLFNKFKKCDLMMLDEPEVRLGLAERYMNLNDILVHKNLSTYKNLIITLGVRGMALKNKTTKKNSRVFLPAFNNKAIDTLGAGDAAYSYASMFTKNTKNLLLIGLLSSIAAGIKASIIGHENYIKSKDVERTLESILK
jgi:rfaE bifunctional protein nucleotidyltransferase chain/domain